jgi:histidyl-tRNA synthetase
MADRSGAAFAAIVGADEVARDVVTLRRLADGVQETLPTAEVVDRLATSGDAT